MSLQPLNLQNIFSQGIKREVRITIASGMQSPQQGKRWLILDGIIGHVTGTITSFLKTKRPGSGDPTHPTGFIRRIPSASTGGYYNLFSTIADIESNDASKTSAMLFGLHILDNTDCLFLSSGDADAVVLVNVIEW